MKIGITGATGQLGRIVVEKLKARGASEHLVALVRTPEKASGLGVEVRAFDYETSEAAALQGIDTLLLISGNELGKRAEQHASVVRAAKEAGVKAVVYTSLLRADSSTLSLAPEHYQTEQLIKASGLAYAILRNGWYTENYTGSIPGAVAGGAFIGSAGEGRIASAARADYAEAAVQVLLAGLYDGSIYELAGDTSYTLAELAAEISRQTGKTIPYVNLPESEYAATLQQFGVPEGFAAAIAGWDISASKGDLFDEQHNLSRLIGRPTTSLQRVVEAALAAV